MPPFVAESAVPAAVVFVNSTFFFDVLALAVSFGIKPRRLSGFRGTKERADSYG